MILCAFLFNDLLPSVDLIDLTSSDAGKPINYWMKDLQLYEADKESLDQGKWLTIIDAAQVSLKKIHPHIGALGQTLAFTIQHGEFVQILNVSNNHWITISNIGCQSGHINVYDSMGTNCVPPRTKEQVAAILFSNKKKILLKYKQVQVQRGASDCGAFAIAFATALCSGKNPTDIYFIQHKLRFHLKDCLMQRNITGFPQMLRKRVKGKKKEATEDYEIHCVCRQPDGGNMIQCDDCKQWFHDMCITTNTRVWKNLDSVWLCIICS